MSKIKIWFFKNISEDELVKTLGMFLTSSLKVEASTQVSNYGLIYNYFTEKWDSKIQLLNFLCFNKHFMPFGSGCLRCVFRAFFRRFREMFVKIMIIYLISKHIGT